MTGVYYLTIFGEEGQEKFTGIESNVAEVSRNECLSSFLKLFTFYARLCSMSVCHTSIAASLMNQVGFIFLLEL